MADRTSKPTVAEYYKGKTIFMTGGTGYLGKVYIEKILRSLPDVKKIFILVRSKKGVSPLQRVEQLKKSKVFGLLQDIHPSPFNKIHPIAGDVADPKLGISEEDRQLLIDEVNIVIHGAASIQFKDSICAAININVKGTWEMAELAKEMKSFECFVHISTAYANVFNDDYIGETIYPPIQDWKDLLCLASEQPEALNVLCGRLLCGHPNTYTLTKSLSEQVIKSYSDSFPVTIVRPGLVANSYAEPYRGWVDTLFGPSSFIALFASGILKVSRCDKKTAVDYVAVDHAANGIILTPFDKQVSPVKDLKVVNATYGSSYRVTNDDLYTFGQQYIHKNPVSTVIWHPTVFFTTSKALYSVLFFFLQIIPAIFLDVLLSLSGSKFSATRVLKKAISLQDIYAFFALKDFCFENNQYLALSELVPQQEKQTFNVTFPIQISQQEGVQLAVDGAFSFLLKETKKTPEEIRRLRLRDWLLKILHYTCIGIFGLTLLKLFSKIVLPLHL